MALANGEEASELLHAQAHVCNHILSFINSMSLKCAVQLGIPDIIHNHGKPMTLAELVAALPIHATKTHHVYRLMRILVNSGFFTQQKISENEPDNEGYLLTRSSRLLLKDDPFSLTPFLLLELDPILTKPWDYLSTWFQNEDLTPFETAHERTLWDYAGHEPKFNHIFNLAMASSKTSLVTSVVIDKCKGVFESLDSLVDVGGGTGTIAKAIADEFPHMECISFDLPHVVADLQGCKNLKYVGGDMFEAIPPANAILLKSILHDWNDEECVKLLNKCRQAISSKNKGGKVIIIDIVMKGKESIDTQLFFDMLMMVLVTGRERNEQEWAKLFKEAGFKDYKITPILGLRSLIEVYP